MSLIICACIRNRCVQWRAAEMVFPPRRSCCCCCCCWRERGDTSVSFEHRAVCDRNGTRSEIIGDSYWVSIIIRILSLPRAYGRHFVYPYPMVTWRRRVWEAPHCRSVCTMGWRHNYRFISIGRKYIPRCETCNIPDKKVLTITNSVLCYKRQVKYVNNLHACLIVIIIIIIIMARYILSFLICWYSSLAWACWPTIHLDDKGRMALLYSALQRSQLWAKGQGWKMDLQRCQRGSWISTRDPLTDNKMYLYSVACSIVVYTCVANNEF